MTDIRPEPDLNLGGHDAEPGHIAHSHVRPRRARTKHSRRFAFVVLACAAALTLTGMIYLWPTGENRGGDQTGQNPTPLTADVVAVNRVPCPELPPDVEQPPIPTRPYPCGTVTLELTDGPDRGEQVSTEIPAGPGAPAVAAGDHVNVFHTPDAPSGQQYQIIDHQRGQQLWMFALAAALVVILFGRWRGLAAVGGLAVTFAILLLFIVPAILDGRPPLLVAIVGSAAIMLSVLYLTHGFTVPTSVAVLGTLASLTLTGLLAAAATAALHLTGVASEEAGFLTITYPNVNMQGLLLAGILIGTLGVLDDVAVTQAATVSELAQANRALTTMQLYHAASRVGRAHIASVVNTIVLAYAGASLPLLILLAAGRQPLGEVLTTQMLSQEIIRSVVGTMGLIAAVPITTALAALAARRAPIDVAAPPPPSRPPTAGRRADRRARPDPWADPADDDWPRYNAGQHR